MSVKQQLVLTASMFVLGGCGVSDLTVLEEGTGVDTESDPTMQSESALRETASLDKEFEAAGAEFNVPAAILKSISWAETRYQMVQGEPEFEGQPQRSGVMALWGAQITEGAAKAQVSEEQARTEPLANIRAAAAYLSIKADLAKIDRNDLNAWSPVLAAYSNIEEPEARMAFAKEEVLEALTLGVGRLSTELKTSGRFKLLAAPTEDTVQVAQARAIA